jgi:hypothetical protein
MNPDTENVAPASWYSHPRWFSFRWTNGIADKSHLDTRDRLEGMYGRLNVICQHTMGPCVPKPFWDTVFSVNVSLILAGLVLVLIIISLTTSSELTVMAEKCDTEVSGYIGNHSSKSIQS